MPLPLRRIAALVIVLAAPAWLAGCATTQVTTQWHDPATPPRSLTGKLVLVWCEAREEAMRRLCEDQWMLRLGDRGIPALRSYTLAGAPATNNQGGVLQLAQRNRAAAIAGMQLTSAAYTTAAPASQVGIGIGGGRGGFSFGGIGLSIPLGGAPAAPAMSAESTLTDVATNAIVWTGRAETPGSADSLEQIAALVRVTVEALRTAGRL